MSGGEVRAWMRRWAFDGVDVMALPKDERPHGWQLRPTTEAKCLDDDVPLYAAPPSAPVGVELLCQVYADAYHAGHHDTVEGVYVDVFPVDRDTYWQEKVEEDYAAALAQQPAAEVKGLPAEEVNALPEHARKYIMWLETDADPAGTVRENFRLTEENKALRVMISQQPAAREEMSPDFTDSARAAIAWVLYHHQGGSSPIGQPLRFALGMGADERLPDWRIAEAKRWAEWAGATTADFHRQQPAAVDEVNWRDMYRLQTAMRYMDNDAQLTKERAYRMADNDVAALELQQGGRSDDR